MIYSYPDFYKEFKCVAGDCTDTCCSAWQIVIDDESLEKYEAYDGEYKETLRRNIDWREGVFRHNNHGKCAFLCDDMLCDMYRHMGKDSLCTTCREYPRHTEEFENVREISLSLSCPEVSRMVMNRTEKMTFIVEEDAEEEVFEDFDCFLFSNLEDIREEILKEIQNRDKAIRERMGKVLQIGSSAQRHYDEGELAFWGESEEQDRVSVENEYELLQRQLAFLSEELELLYPDWEQVLEETSLFLFGKGEAFFSENKKRFEAWWRTSHLTPLEIVLEQIMVYFISIYLPGAVYDENIIGKVEACVGHAVELYMLFLARWLKNGERLHMDDVTSLVYRYSREIEHSDENLEQVELLHWFDR